MLSSTDDVRRWLLVCLGTNSSSVCDEKNVVPCHGRGNQWMVATSSLPHFPFLCRITHIRADTADRRQSDWFHISSNSIDSSNWNQVACGNTTTTPNDEKWSECHAIDNKICIYFECDYNKILFDRLPAMINLIEVDKHNQSMCLAITDCFIGGFERSYIWFACYGSAQYALLALHVH